MGGVRTPFWVPADGSGEPEQLFMGDHRGGVTSFSPKGDLVTFQTRAPDSGMDLWVRLLNGAQPPQLFLRTRFTEVGPRFSPDGRWIAYVSDESGRYEVYVEPSGLRTIETAIAPQRARRRDGAWGPIDTALQRVGDVLVPVATAADVRFSAGGAGPFVTLIRDGHSFALSWPAPLPAPTVSGDSATYADVLPDVDLVVRATATGFAHLLVVKTARAAANPGVRRASYRISGDATLKETPGGGLIAEAAGVRIASADPPIMWDTAGTDRARPLVQLAGVSEGGGEPVTSARSPLNRPMGVMLSRPVSGCWPADRTARQTGPERVPPLRASGTPL